MEQADSLRSRGVGHLLPDDEARLLNALRLTFDRRKTHELPSVLEPPPAEWQIPFAAVARECGVSTDLALVFAQVREYLQSVFSKSRR